METDRPDPSLYPPDRIGLAAAAARDAGLAALLLTPGPDLRYLTGYDAHQLERLTCLAIPAAPARRRPPRPGSRSWSCRGWSSPRPRRRPRAAWGWRSSPGTRPTTLTRSSRGGSGTPPGHGRPGRPVRPDVGADGAQVPRRAARRPPGPGQRGAARAAHPQDPRRGGGAAGGGRGHRPGARPGAGLAAGGPDRAAGRGRHRRRDPRGGPRPGRLHDRRLRPERGQPAPRGLRPGPAARATRSW